VATCYLPLSGGVAGRGSQGLRNSMLSAAANQPVSRRTRMPHDVRTVPDQCGREEQAPDQCWQAVQQVHSGGGRRGPGEPGHADHLPGPGGHDRWQVGGHGLVRRRGRELRSVEVGLGAQGQAEPAQGDSAVRDRGHWHGGRADAHHEVGKSAGPRHESRLHPADCVRRRRLLPGELRDLPNPVPDLPLHPLQGPWIQGLGTGVGTAGVRAPRGHTSVGLGARRRHPGGVIGRHRARRGCERLSDLVGR
jgi:hypothetical protein